MTQQPAPEERASDSSNEAARGEQDAVPNATPEPSRSDWQTYKRLLSYVRPHWLMFLLSTAFFLVGSSAEGYFAFLFGELVESFQQSDDGLLDPMLYQIPLMIFGLAVARAIGEVVGEILLSRISFSVVHTLRTELFEQLLDLPSAYFDNSSSGHLVSRITFNVAQLRDTGTEALRSIIQDGGKVIVFLGGMLFISWQLTLIFAAIAPLVGGIVSVTSRRFRSISRRIQNSMGDVTHVASELVSGYRVVRTFGGEGYERNRFTSASNANRKQNLKMVLTKASSTQIIQVLIAGALALLIALLYNPSIAGSMSAGDVVTFLGLAGLLARPIKKLTEVNARLQRGLAAAEDVFAQFDEAREQDTGSVSVDRVEGRVSFNSVGFGYTTSKGPVLRDISFEVAPGETIAIVGQSGSGKSTLVSLIPRFYEPTEGSVAIDGVAVGDYCMADLRRQIALVTQQVTLFNDTLERNIAYGDLADSSPEAIADAAERANVTTFLEDLPDGLQTLLGDNGVLLSGGQRQRVAIARALLKDAPILILDEATSALDTASERHIQQALEEVMRGRTTFVIAHRLSTVENADRIMVLDAGQIIETGTHSELLAADGAYAALHSAQFAQRGRKRAGRSKRHRKAIASNRPAGAPVRSSALLSGSAQPLARAWYGGSLWPKLLLPLAWLYRHIGTRRRQAYLSGRKTPWRAPVPVIVVGNITVGGTGKTPFVVFLVRWLQARGFSPGVVSRGYGGKAPSYPMRVTGGSDVSHAGDEAPLIAARTGVPVVVDPDRVAAVQALLAGADCDIVVSDDGLQHYALGRDVEIVMLDGERGVGNGLPIPSGPLREPVQRLSAVDLCVAVGSAPALDVDCHVASIEATAVVDLRSGQRWRPEEFAARFSSVHALAGIGNPARFSDTLQRMGLTASLRVFPDHHDFSAADLRFPDSQPVVMTEKDAGKVRAVLLNSDLDGARAFFYVEVGLVIPDTLDAALDDVLTAHGVASTAVKADQTSA